MIRTLLCILALLLSFFACYVVTVQNDVIQQQRYNINQMEKNPACMQAPPIKLSDN